MHVLVSCWCNATIEVTGDGFRLLVITISQTTDSIDCHQHHSGVHKLKTKATPARQIRQEKENKMNPALSTPRLPCNSRYDYNLFLHASHIIRSMITRYEMLALTDRLL